MHSYRIAQAQINPTVGDFAANSALIRRHLDLAREAGADLVTFPELALCGYPPEDLLIKPRFLADCQRALDELAPAAEGIAALVGFPHTEGGKAYNAAALLADGKVQAVYHKVELPNYGVFDEKRYFESGDRCLVCDLGGARVQITICEDVWVPGSPVERCASAHGAQLVVNISASPYNAGKLDVRRQTLARFARAAGAMVCYTNLVGGQDELVFDGGCMVIGPDGQMLACAERFSETLLVTDLELPPGREPRAEGLPEPDRISLALPARERRTPFPPACAPRLGFLEEMHHALILGLKDYVAKNGFKKVVLGLSGGIDSALTAALAVEALGADNVVGVTMPSRYTSGETLGDAGQLAENLGIKLFTVPIAGILDAYLGELARALGQGPFGVTEENLQARIRGNIVMALSNRFGWLVLTTGNKSETAVGYCTLYGDMAGGYSVIKDVLKTTVYALSEFVNQRAGRELIPAGTIERPPSAELRPDQKDSDSLPPYEELDPILLAYVEEDKVAGELVEMGFDRAMVGEVVRLVDINEYKRRQAAPGVRISPKAFGKDRRLPITNHYRQET